MSAIITIQDVHKSFGPRHVLAGVSFAIHEQERIGLLGLNGAGKSTLLRLIVGAGGTASLPAAVLGDGRQRDERDDTPDSGLITRRRGLSLAYVPQEPVLDPGHSVREALLDGLRVHTAAQARLAVLAAEVEQAQGRALQAALEEQAALHEHLTHTGGWDPDHELRGLAAALDLPPMDREVGLLSGGERRRVALAQALLSRPEVLALDEPTNHLDLRTVEWLEERLRAHAGTLLLITHDRYFLDRVATRILELDRGQIYSYEGGYSRFLEKQAERLLQEASREQARVSFIRREIDWIRRGPQARGTKQKARIDRFQEAVAARPATGVQGMPVPGAEPPLLLRLGDGQRLGKTILELREVGKSLGGKLLFSGLTLMCKPGDRIGVVGPNGVGKSTLVRTILGEVAPDEGQVVVGQNTRFAYLDQGRSDLDDTRSVLEEVAGDGDHVHLAEGQVHVRTFLRRMLFDDRFADALVGTLSGGERNRVQLAKLLRQGGNFLILDEPTNDLDLMTLGVLEEALCTFAGCALVVSHDRWFLDRVATAILAFMGDGRVELHEGSYSAYRERVAQKEAVQAAALAQVQPEAAQRAPRPQTGQRRLNYREQRELAGMEEAITAAEQRLVAAEAALVDPSVYKDRGAEVPGLLAAVEQARAEVEGLYRRWQELEEIAKQ